MAHSTETFRVITEEYKRRLAKQVKLYTTYNCDDLKQYEENVIVSNTLIGLVHSMVSNEVYMLSDVEKPLTSDYPFTVTTYEYKQDGSHISRDIKFKFAVKAIDVNKIKNRLNIEANLSRVKGI